MPSPFPGMDPFLEGYLWPDVHQALASKIREVLAPQIRPKYVARLEVTVVQDAGAEAEVGVMYPGVQVLRTKHAREAVAPYETRQTRRARFDGANIVAPLTLPLHVEYRQVNVQIRDAGKNKLVTSIEILSPVNKREPGVTKYRKKWQRLYKAGVNLLEIDLLRRGLRFWEYKRMIESPYVISLVRAKMERVEVWPLTLQDHLPVVPVPLLQPDLPVALDLQQVLDAIYDIAAYELTLDYDAEPPPPELSPHDKAWVRKLLQPARKKS
ncbi:MAG: DUF4058 family protein [Chloroflexi bacterium]|nr:DUF4058 family protein [Chloroflexota bacterium]